LASGLTTCVICIGIQLIIGTYSGLNCAVLFHGQLQVLLERRVRLKNLEKWGELMF